MSLGINLPTRIREEPIFGHSNKLFIGNLSGWGIVANNGQNHITGTGVNVDADVNGLDHLVHGGLIEGWMGLSWATESWGGFNDAKIQYQYCMKHVDPSTRYLVSAQQAIDANGVDYVASTNASSRVTPWQAARYGLSIVLQDDGNYNIVLANSNYSGSPYGQLDWPWVDEFTVSDTEVALGEQPAGVGTGYGYMGQGVDPPWSRVTAGVYWRRYHNSSTGKTWIALVNPRGNGAQTITIAQINAAVGAAYVSFKKISGTQSPSVNNGATVTSVTLQDRDGLIARLL